MKRRHILQSLVAAPLAFIIPGLASGQTPQPKPAAGGTGPGPLAESDPMAKALKYVEDASKADPMRTNKQAICGNCQKYAKCPANVNPCKPGTMKDARAACEIFGGKTVTKAGWCLSWVKA